MKGHAVRRAAVVCLLIGSLGAAFPRAGTAHAARSAASTAGTVMAWGDNEGGQLGQGDTVTRPQATRVPTFGSSPVVAVSAGYLSSLALEADGTVWSWGHNDNADLGRASHESCNDYRCSSNPGQVKGLPPISAIAMGNSSSLVLARDGTVWAWGDNRDGQLGDGTTNAAIAPVQVQGLSGVISVSEGRGSSLAVTRDGSVWAWGDDSNGALGVGRSTTLTRSLTPRRIPGFGGAVVVAAGESHCLALLADGTVAAWGLDSSGDIGDGDASTYGLQLPGRVVGLNHVVAIAAGSGDSFAVESDGSVWAWGENDFGQLGSGASDNGSPFVPPAHPTPTRVQGLSGVTGVAAGLDFVLAVKEDGTLWAWGKDASGQLGFTASGTCRTDSDESWCPTPRQVPGVSGVTAAAAANYHSVAVLGGARSTGTSGSSGPSSPPAGATRRFADPSGSYTLTYPSSWVRSSQKGFDLYAHSPDNAIVIAATHGAQSKPGPDQITHDLPDFVASFGKAAGTATYKTYSRSGTTLYVGLTAYRGSNGRVGVAVVAEIYGHHNLCAAVGVVPDATSTTGQKNVLIAAAAVTSLALQ